MWSLKNLSLKRKLIVTNVLGTGLALGVACALFMTFDVLSFRQAMVEDLIVHADMIGANSTAAVSFADEKGAAEVLSSLRADPHIQAACLYLPDGKQLAAFQRAEDSRGFPMSAPSFEYAFQDGALELTRPVSLGGQKICTVFMRGDIEELYGRMKMFGAVLASVFITSLAAAAVVSGKLQRQIAEPVLHLAATARAVSADKNYTLRAKPGSNDELGQLSKDFNDMLEQISARDVQLQAHHERLEDQVARRTAELTQSNEALAHALDAAEGSNRAKSAFLANMSHEIRTPMTAILGYADLLLEPGQGASDRLNHIQTIRRNSQHLLTIINDILDLSKIESGHMTVERMSCSPARIAADVSSLMRVKAAEKKLGFTLTFDGGIAETIVSDPTRLRQILLNLVGNAVKFTSVGEVRLRVRMGDAGTQQIWFIIEDTGIGIAASELQRLFKPFTQADVSTTRKFGGTGLGLTISKRLAELLGGDITVTPRRGGQGTVFEVSVATGPLENVTILRDVTESSFAAEFQQGLSRTPEAETMPGRILLAEDGEDNQRLISHHLRSAGATVTIVENGRLALEAAMEAANDGRPFDVILMDMQMPELDGYGATARLREYKYTGTIIALTAHAMAADREKCLRAGCTDYLTKPIDRRLLIDTVRRYVNAARSAREASASPPVDGGSAEILEAPLIGAAAKGTLLRSDFCDDPDLQGILTEYIAAMPQQVARIAELLEAGQVSELRQAVHRIKGAAGGYGFPQITQAAGSAERQIDSSSPLEALAVQVNELTALMRQVDGYQAAKERNSAT